MVAKSYISVACVILMTSVLLVIAEVHDPRRTQDEELSLEAQGEVGVGNGEGLDWISMAQDLRDLGSKAAVQQWMLRDRRGGRNKIRNKPGGRNRAGGRDDTPLGGEPPPPPPPNHSGRQYDVPQIECPPAEDGFERFACPAPDLMGRYKCIDAHNLCDGFSDCPGAQDEDRLACMFYKTTKAHLDVLADALLRWHRGRR